MSGLLIPPDLGRTASAGRRTSWSTSSLVSDARSDNFPFWSRAENPGVSVGSYPFFKDGRYGANFVVRCDDGEAARRCTDELRERLAAAGYETVDGGI